MDCQLAEVFDALSGAEPRDLRMVEPPAELRAPPTRRAAGKGVYGGNLEHHVDGTNFTVQWRDDTIDPARAQAILDELESAWTVLVETDGWPAPVSSDQWLLWVILDPTLSGSGYTTVYSNDDYPQGYPVSYVSPEYGADDYPAFALSVAVHEFGHMLQYRVRDWAPGGTESWFWEATSEWVAEHAAPDIDTYALSSYWYAEAPDARFDSVADYHQYGMLLLNAWIDQQYGFDRVKDVWLASEGVDAPWDTIIAGAVGEDFGAIIDQMAAALAAGTLRESALYEEPVRVDTVGGTPETTTLDLPGLYGTYYLDFRIAVPRLYVEGPVLTSYVQDGVVTPTPPAEGAFTAVITAVGTDGQVTYGVREDDEGDDGDDTGGVADTAGDDPPETAGCACGTSGRAGGGAAFGLLAAGLAFLRSRR